MDLNQNPSKRLTRNLSIQRASTDKNEKTFKGYFPRKKSFRNDLSKEMLYMANSHYEVNYPLIFLYSGFLIFNNFSIILFKKSYTFI